MRLDGRVESALYKRSWRSEATIFLEIGTYRCNVL